MAQSLPRDLVSLLDLRAQEAPARIAYRYLGETTGPTELSTEALRDGARAVAARLDTGGLRGERVLLRYPPGLDFITGFLGCCVAGVTAVPAPPPNPLKPKRSLERLMTIVDSAKPRWALTTSAVLDALRPALAELPAFDALRWIATDVPTRGLVLPDMVPGDPADLALIQYTSGSTSDPKGAALSQENVLANMAYFDDGWDHGPDTVAVNWLPAFHDLGLIYGILTPLWRGFTALQMSPIDVIQKPFSWLAAISRNRATHSCGPNFIYDLCTRKVTNPDLATLDLGSWRMALTAAEPVRAETMDRFVERFEPVGFRRRTFCPGFGLSEGTCKVVALPCDEDPIVLALRADRLEQHEVVQAPPGPGTRTVVGCGRPGRDVRVEIVDPDTSTRLPGGRVGEVWVAGHGVAHSYWDQPQATADLLQARIQGGDDTPHLRTGDLGFMHQEQLFITGRIKDLIIIRGTNHYPQDIESTVQDAHPNIRAGCCAAFSFEEDVEERLAVVVEVERRVRDTWTVGGERRSVEPSPRLPPAPGIFLAQEVAAAITRAVSEVHGLKAHRLVLIQAGTIPKTTSGKIQRQACKRALFADRLALLETEVEAARPLEPDPRDVLRDKVVAIVSEISGIPREQILPRVSLHSMGIDSLTGVNIAYELGLLTGRDVPSWVLAEHDTIDKLVDYVLSLGGAR
jgi:myxalamid-type polyketide synthase MxaE and MxaD